MAKTGAKRLAVGALGKILHSTVALEKNSAFYSYSGLEGPLAEYADDVTLGFTLFAASKRSFYSTLTLEMTGKMMDHNWHYDLTDDHELSQDPESLLVWLCDQCAKELDEKVQFAGTDSHYDSPCWHCGA